MYFQAENNSSLDKRYHFVVISDLHLLVAANKERLKETRSPLVSLPANRNNKSYESISVSVCGQAVDISIN
jgi:hypothetical protein